MHIWRIKQDATYPNPRRICMLHIDSGINDTHWTVTRMFATNLFRSRTCMYNVCMYLQYCLSNLQKAENMWYCHYYSYGQCKFIAPVKQCQRNQWRAAGECRDGGTVWQEKKAQYKFMLRLQNYNWVSTVFLPEFLPNHCLEINCLCLLTRFHY